MKTQLPKSYDILGSIAILKFPEKPKTKQADKKTIAELLLKERKNITTVLEKADKVRGRLRTFKTKYLAGVKTKETVYKENNCQIKLNVEKCYFSPRLSNDRLEVARKIKKSDSVLIMFSGVNPYGIVISKLAKPKQVVSVEINKIASKYAQENSKLNKLENIEVIQGDVKRILPKLVKRKLKFNVIIMPRPQLKETFLKQAFDVSKKGARIFYHGFSKDSEETVSQIKQEAEKEKKKIKILEVKKAGEIAPYKFRWRIQFTIL